MSLFAIKIHCCRKYILMFLEFHLKKCNQLVLNFRMLWTSRRVHQVFGIQITRYSSQLIARTKLVHSKIWNSHFKVSGIVYEYMTLRSFFVVWGILNKYEYFYTLYYKINMNEDLLISKIKEPFLQPTDSERDIRIPKLMITVSGDSVQTNIAWK